MEYVHEQKSFFVKEQEEIIGSVSVVEKSLSTRRTIDGRRVYLQSLDVKKEFRRQGYATGLLQYVFEWYAAQGVTEFTIAVDTKNHVAKNLYEKMGFELLQYGFDCYRNVGYELLLYQYRGKGAECV